MVDWRGGNGWVREENPEGGVLQPYPRSLPPMEHRVSWDRDVSLALPSPFGHPLWQTPGWFRMVKSAEKNRWVGSCLSPLKTPRVPHVSPPTLRSAREWVHSNFLQTPVTANNGNMPKAGVRRTCRIPHFCCQTRKEKIVLSG